MICAGIQKEKHWPDDVRSSRFASAAFRHAIDDLFSSYSGSQWTAVTTDGKASAQFEETLLITPTGVEVLTAAPGWTLPQKKVAEDTSAAKKKKKGKK